MASGPSTAANPILPQVRQSARHLLQTCPSTNALLLVMNERRRVRYLKPRFLEDARLARRLEKLRARAAKPALDHRALRVSG